MLFLEQQQLAVNKTLEISKYVNLVQNMLSRKKKIMSSTVETEESSNFIRAACWTASYNYLIKNCSCTLKYVSK